METGGTGGTEGWGVGARENRGRERDLSRGRAGKEIKEKHTRFLFITVYHLVLRPIPI